MLSWCSISRACLFGVMHQEPSAFFAYTGGGYRLWSHYLPRGGPKQCRFSFLKSLFTRLLDRGGDTLSEFMNVLDLGGEKKAAVYLRSMKNETAVIHGRHFSEEAEGDAACRRVQPCPLTKKTLLGWMLGWCDDFSDTRIWVSIWILVSDLRFKAARWKPR